MVTCKKRRLPPHLLAFCALFALALGAASCGGDDSAPLSPNNQPDQMGEMPPVPKPTSLTTEAQSETVTVTRPLRVVYAPGVTNALADWRIQTRGCTEELWIPSCGGWSAVDYPDTWMSDLPEQWGYSPPTPFKVQLLGESGGKIEPTAYEFYKGNLHNRRCGFLDLDICWNDALWSAPLRQLTNQPYLCRDRYWVVAGKSQILPQGFSQEITTTITRGVERTECDEFAVSVTVEGTVSDGFNSLKTAISASYSKSVTESVFEEQSVETKYTPEPVPDGKQAVYQVWVLVDRYTITDKSGKPFSDPSYGLGACKRVHVQGVWEAHAITYFPNSSAATVSARY